MIVYMIPNMPRHQLIFCPMLPTRNGREGMQLEASPPRQLSGLVGFLSYLIRRDLLWYILKLLRRV